MVGSALLNPRVWTTIKPKYSQANSHVFLQQNLHILLTLTYFLLLYSVLKLLPLLLRFLLRLLPLKPPTLHASIHLCPTCVLIFGKTNRKLS